MNRRPPNFSYLPYLFIIKEGQLINGPRQLIITFWVITVAESADYLSAAQRRKWRLREYSNSQPAD